MTKEKKQTSKALPAAKPSKPETAIPGNWKGVWKEYGKLGGGEARAALLARYGLEKVLPRIWNAFAEWQQEIAKADAALLEIQPLSGVANAFNLIALAFTNADLAIQPGRIVGYFPLNAGDGMTPEERQKIILNAVCTMLEQGAARTRRRNRKICKAHG